MNIRQLESADIGYALCAWREGFKKSPGIDRLPWAYVKDVHDKIFKSILDDPETRLLGGYTDDNKLIGWTAITPGKRVHTVHWVHVKHELDGESMRRRGVMLALLEAAGPRFIYTLHARRDRATLPDGSVTKSLDESLVAALRARGITATFVAMKEWLK